MHMQGWTHRNPEKESAPVINATAAHTQGCSVCHITAQLAVLAQLNFWNCAIAHIINQCSTKQWAKFYEGNTKNINTYLLTM
jgi:hypothetical protein